MFSTAGVAPVKRGPIGDGNYKLAIAHGEDGQAMMRIDQANSGTTFIEVTYDLVEYPGRRIKQTWFITEKAYPFMLGDLLTSTTVDELPTFKGSTPPKLALAVVEWYKANIMEEFTARIERTANNNGFPEIVQYIG